MQSRKITDDCWLKYSFNNLTFVKWRYDKLNNEFCRQNHWLTWSNLTVRISSQIVVRIDCATRVFCRVFSFHKFYPHTIARMNSKMKISDCGFCNEVLFGKHKFIIQCFMLVVMFSTLIVWRMQSNRKWLFLIWLNVFPTLNTNLIDK